MPSKYTSRNGPWEPGMDKGDTTDPTLYCPVCDHALSVEKTELDKDVLLRYYCTYKRCVPITQKRRTNHSALGIMAIYPQKHPDPMTRLLVSLPVKTNLPVETLLAPVETWAQPSEDNHGSFPQADSIDRGTERKRNLPSPRVRSHHRR